MTRARRRRGGFTLVETLVAVTLLALLFGALLPVFQNGLTALRRGDQHLRAVQLAESLLARTASALPGSTDGTPQPASSDGEEDGFTWVLTREPYTDEDGGPPLGEKPVLVLVRVSALVTWEGNPHGVRLSTLALERAP